LWAGDPLGYHVVTLLLHGGNAVLLALLLIELGYAPIAWWAAFLFALHPLNVESAAWMTELKNTQSTFFLLLSLLAICRFFSFSDQTSEERGFDYALAILFYLA